MKKIIYFSKREKKIKNNVSIKIKRIKIKNKNKKKFSKKP